MMKYYMYSYLICATVLLVEFTPPIQSQSSTTDSDNSTETSTVISTETSTEASTETSTTTENDISTTEPPEDDILSNRECGPHEHLVRRHCSYCDQCKYQPCLIQCDRQAKFICTCDEGYLRDAGNCVLKTDCP